ncbi:cytidine deaminase [Conidiobolus coronatus NRRL 28638]|uniref:Cytidine deaminase n=1 Tax=Conidiobolus coronatus (strain ATCC 28846 / CBS 209.66 / NRRL 28638) TaxID=796925 RepID=A0A137P9S1_CONC2|nr:cytidine deaminase [Conidiobolus coronatus NRRL 28638]|eukprot:KXN71743.1 cytidine deaminase [Conidiobolus coronatus NRRL 28638]
MTVNTITQQTLDELIKTSLNIRANSYSPYSKFRVGAALLTEEGEIITGVNVENASLGGTICAERTAFCKAISEGKSKFVAIAVSGDTSDHLSPCGICRQFMYEFNPNLLCYMLNDKGEYKVKTLGDLLPDGFGPVQYNRKHIN